MIEKSVSLECFISVRTVLADLASSLYSIMFSNIAHEIEYEVHDARSEVQDVV